jgi:hypothetical protein
MVGVDHVSTARTPPWEERICAENVGHDYNFNYFSDNAKLPSEDSPDF